MRIGWAGKVALGAVLPVLLGMGAFTLITLDNVRNGVRNRIVDELRGEVTLLSLTLSPEESTKESLARMGDALDVRITLISADGVVSADSEAEAATMENHGNRPEVVEARRGDIAVVQRYSRTVQRSLIYAASRLRDSDVVVRIAKDVSDVEQAMTSDTRTFWAVAVIVLAVGLILALLFARSVIKPVRGLTDAAMARARGDPSARALPRGDDELAQLGSAFNEMTERLDASIAAAQAETARLATTLGGMSEGVLAVDSEERIVFLNSAAREVLGLDVKGVGGTRLYEHVREPTILGLVQAAIRDGRPAEAEIAYEGPPRRMIQVYAARAGADVILVLRDMSKMRRLERMRTDFVSNVSHELRTPLATIAAAVETLEDEEARRDPDTGPRFVEMLRRNVCRLEALLDDILALSRFESRPESLQRVPVDIAKVGRTAAEELQERARRAGVSLTVTANDRLPVEGDAEALRRVVDNLIVNAITYTPKGGSVEVSLRRSDGQAVLTVKDNGIGIPVGDQTRIFERFYRVDKGRSRSAGGTGLGLAIVKHAVGLHGGDVEVDSEPGAGSSFAVRLPLAASGENS